jgi:OOP family OmpA-OmpF porin
MTIKKYLIFPLTAVLFFIASSAMAGNGWYSGVNLGLNFQNDQESTGPNRVVDLNFDTGGFFAGQLGYKFRGTSFGRFRIEAELSYRQNDVDEIVFNGVERIGSGEEEVLTGLMNLFYDFNAKSKRFIPFVGAGIGLANIDADVAYSPNAFIDDDDTTFAYQFIAGAEYKLTKDLSLIGDARYFALDDPELTRFGGPAPAAFVELDSEYDSFSTTIGLRYNF